MVKEFLSRRSLMVWVVIAPLFLAGCGFFTWEPSPTPPLAFEPGRWESRQSEHWDAGEYWIDLHEDGTGSFRLPIYDPFIELDGWCSSVDEWPPPLERTLPWEVSPSGAWLSFEFRDEPRFGVGIAMTEGQADWSTVLVFPCFDADLRPLDLYFQSSS